MKIRITYPAIIDCNLSSNKRILGLKLTNVDKVGIGLTAGICR